MSKSLGLLFAALATVTAGCTDESLPRQQPNAASPPAAVPTASQRLPLPDGDLLARRLGTGSQELGEVSVSQPSSLYFRCTQGAGAVLTYGTGSQPCPNGNRNLSIAVTPQDEPLPLSVEAPEGVEWEISAATGG